MKTFSTIAAIASIALLTIAFISTAQADNKSCVFQGPTVPESQIEQNVQKLGDTIITSFFEKEIEINNSCVYKVKAKDNTGNQWVLYFDPNNGNLIAKKPKHD